MHKPRFSVLSALLSAGRVMAGMIIPSKKMGEPGTQMYRVAAGKNYVSRSCYTPGGRNRNCGDRGISPKSFHRHQKALGNV